MATEKAKPGDTILVKYNKWNSEWMIGKEYTVVRHASCGFPSEVTVKTPQGEHFVKHHNYKIVRRKGKAVVFKVGDIVMWEFMGTKERCRIVEHPIGSDFTPTGEVWLQGLEATSAMRPTHGPTRNLTLLESGGVTETKNETCPDCKGTGRITMLNWDVDCNCVK